MDIYSVLEINLIMDKKPPDRRQQRTRKLLYQAFVALVLEHGYDKLRIRDLTDHANLGYSTFYLHYDDKRELLEAYLAEEFRSIGRSRTRRDETQANEQQLGLATFRYIEENRDFYRHLLRSQAAAAVIRQLRRTIAASVQQDLQVITRDNPSALPLDLLAHYVAGSVVGLIDWWVENDFRYSAEYIVQIYRRLIDPGLYQALYLKSDKDT
jgi:AcrR family transcriptional regulator